MSDEWRKKDVFSFEGEQEASGAHFVASGAAPKIVEWVLKTGWVKTREQANWTLFCAAIIIAIISLFFFGNLRASPKGYDPIDPLLHPGIMVK